MTGHNDDLETRNHFGTERGEHKAGEKLFVDWAGDTIRFTIPAGVRVMELSLLVAANGLVAPQSSYSVE
jgi:hypothetical protein